MHKNFRLVAAGVVVASCFALTAQALPLVPSGLSLTATDVTLVAADCGAGKRRNAQGVCVPKPNGGTGAVVCNKFGCHTLKPGQCRTTVNVSGAGATRVCN